MGMETLLANWKKFVAGQLKVDWQRDFFDQRLRDHHPVQQKPNYVLMNPVRNGLGERAEEWPWVYRPKERQPPLLG